MKPFQIFAFTSVIYICAVHASAQGTFQNLDFESANLSGTPSSTQDVYIPIANALPGWTGFFGANQATGVLYNDITAGAANISLISSSATNGIARSVIGGAYTAVLQSGDVTGGPASAAIAQTGLVPTTAKSIIFDANIDSVAGFLTVSFNGQNIAFSPLSTGANYEVYGGDISAFAGQTGELRFTENPTAADPFAYAFLDNIQFSTVPEPGTCALILCGVVAFGVARRKFKV